MARLGAGTRELLVDPVNALLHVLFVAAFDAELVEQQVDRLMVEPEGDTFVRDEGGVLKAIEPGMAALYGRTYHLTGVFTGEGRPHVLWGMHEAAQRRLREAAESCLKANISERRTQVAEREAHGLVAFAHALLPDLGHSLNDPTVKTAIRKALTHVASMQPAKALAKSSG